MIDGETLPLLTEDHLLDTMGLKLGPALKIRSQVDKPSNKFGQQTKRFSSAVYLIFNGLNICNPFREKSIDAHFFSTLFIIIPYGISISVPPRCLDG